MSHCTVLCIKVSLIVAISLLLRVIMSSSSSSLSSSSSSSSSTRKKFLVIVVTIVDSRHLPLALFLRGGIPMQVTKGSSGGETWVSQGVKNKSSFGETGG